MIDEQSLLRDSVRRVATPEYVRKLNREQAYAKGKTGGHLFQSEASNAENCTSLNESRPTVLNKP